MKQSAPAWEGTCNKCGLCCHEKVIMGRTVVYDLDSYCEYYDPKTRQCLIYFKRLEAQARCRRVTRFTAMFASYLPDTCAYVQWARSHHIRFAPRRYIRYVHGDRGNSSDDEDSAPSLNSVK